MITNLFPKGNTHVFTTKTEATNVNFTNKNNVFEVDIPRNETNTWQVSISQNLEEEYGVICQINNGFRTVDLDPIVNNIPPFPLLTNPPLWLVDGFMVGNVSLGTISIPKTILRVQGTLFCFEEKIFTFGLMQIGQPTSHTQHGKFRVHAYPSTTHNFSCMFVISDWVSGQDFSLAISSTGIVNVILTNISVSYERLK